MLEPVAGGGAVIHWQLTGVVYGSFAEIYIISEVIAMKMIILVYCYCFFFLIYFNLCFVIINQQEDFLYYLNFRLRLGHFLCFNCQ